jgi:hypothetical protein
MSGQSISCSWLNGAQTAVGYAMIDATGNQFSRLTYSVGPQDTGWVAGSLASIGVLSVRQTYGGVFGYTSGVFKCTSSWS